jgi:hypothetical protein
MDDTKEQQLIDALQRAIRDAYVTNHVDPDDIADMLSHTGEVTNAEYGYSSHRLRQPSRTQPEDDDWIDPLFVLSEDLTAAWYGAANHGPVYDRMKWHRIAAVVQAVTHRPLADLIATNHSILWADLLAPVRQALVTTAMMAIRQAHDHGAPQNAIEDLLACVRHTLQDHNGHSPDYLIRLGRRENREDPAMIELATTLTAAWSTARQNGLTWSEVHEILESIWLPNINGILKGTDQ